MALMASYSNHSYFDIANSVGDTNTPKCTECPTYATFLTYPEIFPPEIVASQERLYLEHLRKDHKDKLEKLEETFIILQALKHEAEQRIAIQKRVEQSLVDEKLEQKSGRLDAIE